MRYEFVASSRGLSAEDLERLIERLSESVPSEGLRVELKGDKVRILVEGPARPIDYVRLAVQSALSEVMGSRPYRTEVRVRDLLPQATSMPADLLAEALRRRGFGSEAQDDVVRTHAPLDVVREVAFALVKVWNEVVTHKELSRSARKAIALASFMSLRPVGELIEVGVREGVLGKSKANKVLAVTDWVSAADRIRRSAGLD
ncbi:MAG: DUF2067 domain-containing protein [Acidilobus sp.]|jgi:hypothetical protein|nr:DUF2067 domain-containing protein [Acidilobus sp.]